MLSICCDETITYISEENCYKCSLCGREIASEEMYPYEEENNIAVSSKEKIDLSELDGLDEEDFDENLWNEPGFDLGGTGHGDDSLSDADPGL